MRQVNLPLKLTPCGIGRCPSSTATRRQAPRCCRTGRGRTRVELIQRNEFIELQATEVDELRAEVAKAGELLAEMKAELSDVRMEIRHARDREAAAVAKAQTCRGRAPISSGPASPRSGLPNRCKYPTTATTLPLRPRQPADLLHSSKRCWYRTRRTMQRPHRGNVDRSVRRSFAWRRHRKLWRSGRVPRPVRRSAHHRRLQRGEARLAESSARGAARRVA